MQLRIFGLFAICMALSACATLGGGVVYDYDLDKSTKSADATGEISNIRLDSRHFGFQFKNKSSSLSKIVWDESTIVDTSGNPHRLLPDGSKYIDAGRSIPPAIVPSGGQIQTFVAYADGLRSIGTTWVEELLVPCIESGQFCKPDEYYGKSLTLILTVETEGKKKEYQSRILLKKKTESHK